MKNEGTDPETFQFSVVEPKKGPKKRKPAFFKGLLPFWRRTRFVLFFVKGKGKDGEASNETEGDEDEEDEQAVIIKL